MKLVTAIMLLSTLTALGAISESSRAQTITGEGGLPPEAVVAASGRTDSSYTRPTYKKMADNYLFDAFGPYPIGAAAFSAGIGQANNTPPEWRQGFEGYSKRFGSDFGIAAVSTTTRYGLSQVLKQDAIYYRCGCDGVVQRLGHAMISTLTARRGEDGHRVFSIPDLVAPYAGSMTAVYGWYPGRYGAKDAFRSGNYSLLISLGENIALEFVYRGPRSLFHHLHLRNAHRRPESGPRQ